MTVNLAQNDFPFRRAEDGDTIGPVVFRLADDAHLASSRAARKEQRIANYHADFILEKDSDSLSALSKRGSSELRRALALDPREITARGNDFHFALLGAAATLRVFRQSREVPVLRWHKRGQGKKRASNASRGTGDEAEIIMPQRLSRLWRG